MNNLKRHCLYCNSAIYGRADKKFCGDNCRSGYNNARRKDFEDEVSLIKNILIRNRRILSKVLKDGEESVKLQKDRLSLMGFNFKYHTHHFLLEKDKLICFNFEYGYIDQGKGMVLVVRDIGEHYLKKFG